MGFLDKLKGKKNVQPELKMDEDKPVKPKQGTVSLLWGPADRRHAEQYELQELQAKMADSAQQKIDRYKPVFSADDEIRFGEMDSKTAGLLQILADNDVLAGGMPREFERTLGMNKKEWPGAISRLESEGYIRCGAIEDRINDMKYSVLLEQLKDNGIIISTSDKVERVKEIIDKTEPSLLEKILADVPERYAVTAEGKRFLDDNPLLGEYYGEDDFGITISQAYKLKSLFEGDLFSLCQTMYREQVEAYWSLAKYKEYMEYSEKLAYLEMRRNPIQAAYALAHLINGNSLYKSGKIFWEVPLKTVYTFSTLSVDELARYAAEEFPYGIYPKRTKVDKFNEVFHKYLQGTKKA